MKLALFDLDHTLIPFDSGMAWTRFLVAAGRLPAEAEASYLAYCHQYVAGTLDIHAMHRAIMAPLRSVAPAELAAWAAAFEAAMRPSIPQGRRAWVRAHRAAGDLCAIVTATERFIAAPFARLFGVDELLATEAVKVNGFLTGEIAGEPCYREHKLHRVQQWLASRGASLCTFESSYFYSDSTSDLALLRAVSNPVAVCPDARLRQVAGELGWPVLEPV